MMILLLTLPLLLGSCGLLAKHFGKKAKPDKDAGTKDVSIGIIELVNWVRHGGRYVRGGPA